MSLGLAMLITALDAGYRQSRIKLIGLTAMSQEKYISAPTIFSYLLPNGNWLTGY